MADRIVTPKQLDTLLKQIFVAAGTPEDIAHCVSAVLVDSNLKGVDSHGAIRVTKYVNEIFSGWIKPTARPEIIKETPSTAIVKGNVGFGIYTLNYAMNLAIQKAKGNQIAAVGLIESTHTGRLGWFVERAVEQGMMGIIIGGGAHKTPSVAPYGGKSRIVATNPWTIGFPGGKFGPVVVDISTSASAEGKLQVYRAKKEAVPAGWIQDQNGNPTTNVEDFYAGGALLPAGGHKGYGLAIIAELLGYALLGEVHAVNWFILAIDISAFRHPPEFVLAAEDFLSQVKNVPPASGFKEVLIPGELELRFANQREKQGIPISDEIWQQMKATAQRVGVDAEASQDTV